MITGMGRKAAVIAGAACAVGSLLLFTLKSREPEADRALAAALANDTTRSAAVASIVAAGRGKLPLLLFWAKTPPKGVVTCGFETGLADALGELRATEAIPFLVSRITMKRSCGANFAPWLKTIEVLKWNLPSVGALVRIGPDASRSLIKNFHQLPDGEDRIAALFVVAQIKGVPEARPFLQTALRQASAETYWSQEGINLINGLGDSGK